MKACDFPSSFYKWGLDRTKQAPRTMSVEQPFTVNETRTPLECRCLVTDPAGTTTEYVLGAACKTERLNVDRDIWTQPNADYMPVGSEQDYLRIKSWDRNNKGVKLYPETLGVQSERQYGKVAGTYHFHQINLSMRDARVLETNQQIVDAFRANRHIVSTTQYTADDGSRIVLEYPVKTLNVSERDGFYQIDTGPVLYAATPDDPTFPITRFRLAFIAHNAPDWAEFLVHVPTVIAEGISVSHYSKTVRVDSRNAMLELL